MKVDVGGVEINWAALAPILLLSLGFVIWCFVDISRNEVRYLPKWLWAIICVISIPLGGIVYLLIGRDNSPIR
ncbi:MAG: PLDc N-terminal domain-containing protein [Acidimicrobiia bacterium]|nr:PLDc N-terminal domain-containing protein [Acidimicrobiia bacterium]